MKQSIYSEMTNEEKKKTIRALLKIFPSRKSFLDFQQGDNKYSEKAIWKFIQKAKEKDIIKECSKEEFESFIEKNSSYYEETVPSEELTFAGLIEDAKKELSVNRLIEQLNEKAKYFEMPVIQASMFTRLKENFDPNTSKKRCLLRMLAYWIGENRPQLNWNYEQLLRLPKYQIVKETEGVIIAVKISSRGDIISRDAIDWLKNELSQCVDDLYLSNYINKKDIKIHSVNSVCIKLPKKKGPSEEPRLYAQPIRDAVAIGHQINIRWLLSDHSTQQRSIIIGIYAGNFIDGDIFIRYFLESQFYKDSNILLTDFGQICAEVSDVKVAFEKSPESFNLGMGYIITMWQVRYLWTYTYFDFPTPLLKEEMLPTTDRSYERFKQELYFPEEVPKNTFKALSKIHQFSQNTSLLIEIAKTLLARRMFHEADTVLSKILTLNPCHTVARMMRMIIYFNIALEQSNFSDSEFAFNRAIDEGIFITSHPECAIDEEVWSEFGLAYYGIALRYLVLLREENKKNDNEKIEEKIHFYLEKAEKSFEQGMIVSSTGKDNRSLFWLLYARGLRELLKEDKSKSLFIRDQQGLVDNYNILKRVGMSFFSILGWIEKDFLEKLDEDPLTQLVNSETQQLVKILLHLINIYENSVLARNYIPNIKYAFCCLIWDFVPKLTVGLCKQILIWLEEAITVAKKLCKDKIAIYSTAAYFLQFQSPEGFIDCMNTAVKTIKNIISDDILKQSDNTFLDDKTLAELSKVKLMFLHIDRPIERGVLVHKTKEA